MVATIREFQRTLADVVGLRRFAERPECGGVRDATGDLDHGVPTERKAGGANALRLN